MARLRAEEDIGAALEATVGTPVPSVSEPVRAPQRRLTALLVVPTLEAGAADVAVVHLARVLQQAGHNAIVASRGGRLAVDVCRAGAEWLPLEVGSLNPLRTAVAALRLRATVLARDCDIVHAHARAAAWCALPAARSTGRAFVTTLHNGFRQGRRLKRFYDGVMARGDRVVASGEDVAAMVCERFGASRERVVVTRPALDVGRFDPTAMTEARISAMRRRLGISPYSRMILVPGRLRRRKGHHVVVAAVRRLKAAGLKDFACVFASEEADTNYAGELWDRVIATDTHDVVRLAGHVDDVAAAYAAATVVVSAALQQDGVQRALLEAQAMSVPVVVSDRGAGQDVVLAPPAVAEDRMTGLRVPAGDDAALATALLRLFSMPEALRTTIGRRGRSWIEANFAPERTATQMLAVYAELAGRRDS